MYRNVISNKITQFAINNPFVFPRYASISEITVS